MEETSRLTWLEVQSLIGKPLFVTFENGSQEWKILKAYQEKNKKVVFFTDENYPYDFDKLELSKEEPKEEVEEPNEPVEPPTDDEETEQIPSV